MNLHSKINSKFFFPVMGNTFSEKDYCTISLAANDVEVIESNVTSFEGLDNYVKRTLEKNNAKIAVGGYGEHRIIYSSSDHYNNDINPRCIHLGIDFWTNAHTPVYAPLDGKIHSFKYNDKVLDYGTTIITEHRSGKNIFWLLFGHLSLDSIKNLKAGQKIKRGEQIATLGEPYENGGWSPHLHLQCITDLGNWWGDFPGVATLSDAAYYLEICPNLVG